MFNASLHEKRLLAKQRAEQEHSLQAKARQRSTVVRSVLAEKYSKRIDQFILTMINDPIQVRQHVGPLAVAGRDTDPEKYKGPTSMVMKGYRTEQERVKDAIAANRYLSLEPMKPHEFRPRNQSKEINPNMYFTSKPKAVKEGLLRHRSSIKPRASFAIAQKSPLSRNPTLTHSVSTSIVDIDRKTHFKGVMSKLMNLSLSASEPEPLETEENAAICQRTKTASILWKHARVLNRSALQQYEGAAMAKEALENCRVVPKGVGSSFLRVGEGKLTSNPFMPNREAYGHLHTYLSHASSRLSS